MRQSYALVLAVFLTAFILALALGFAQLSSEERSAIRIGHDDVAAWRVGAVWQSAAVRQVGVAAGEQVSWRART